MTKTKVACKMDFSHRESQPRNYPSFITGAYCGYYILPTHDYKLELGWKPQRVLTTKG